MARTDLKIHKIALKLIFGFLLVFFLAGGVPAQETSVVKVPGLGAGNKLVKTRDANSRVDPLLSRLLEGAAGAEKGEASLSKALHVMSGSGEGKGRDPVARELLPLVGDDDRIPVWVYYARGEVAKEGVKERERGSEEPGLEGEEPGSEKRAAPKAVVKKPQANEPGSEELDSGKSGEGEPEEPAEHVEHASDGAGASSRRVDLEELGALAKDPKVAWVTVPPRAVPMAGPIVTEGVSLAGADLWHKSGWTGKGVTVGVLDEGFTGYRTLQSKGELPSDIVARSFSGRESIETSPHGAACAEVIHDMAPDARLVLATPAAADGYLAAIDWLISQKVNIISCSMGFILGPSDGQSYVDRNFKKATDAGITVIISAGNEAQTHWSGTPERRDPRGVLVFPGGHEGVVVEAETKGSFFISYDDWLHTIPPKSRDGVDYDCYLWDSDSRKYVAESKVEQYREGPPPQERIEVKRPGSYILVFTSPQAAPPMREIHVYASSMEVTLRQDSPSPARSVLWPADSPDVLAVGAWDIKSDHLAPYSSQGPTSDGRSKPDLSAQTAVKTQTALTYPDYFGVAFGGTSAACPHVAGAAALLAQKLGVSAPEKLMPELRRLVRTVDLDSNQAGAGILRLPQPEEGSVGGSQEGAGSLQEIVRESPGWLKGILEGSRGTGDEGPSVSWDLPNRLKLEPGREFSIRVEAHRDVYVTLLRAEEGRVKVLTANQYLGAGEKVKIVSEEKDELLPEKAGRAVLVLLASESKLPTPLSSIEEDRNVEAHRCLLILSEEKGKTEQKKEDKEEPDNEELR